MKICARILLRAFLPLLILAGAVDAKAQSTDSVPPTGTAQPADTSKPVQPGTSDKPDIQIVYKKKPRADAPAPPPTVVTVAPPTAAVAMPSNPPAYVGAAPAGGSGSAVPVGGPAVYVGAAAGGGSGGAVWAGTAGGAPNLAARVMERKLGPQGFQSLVGQLEAMRNSAATGRGAPMADRWFDGAAQRTGNDDGLRPAGTNFFGTGGAPSAPPPPVAAVRGTYKPATVQDAATVTKTYGSIPGGVVLEGALGGLGSYSQVAYDRRFHAFILDNRVVYFVKVPARTVAIMCAAIAGSDLVGVSLGETQIVYGKVPETSDLAYDLKLADHFLGGIVFAQGHWTEGYKFANGYHPRKREGKSFSMAVFFNFNGFEFRATQEELALSGANFDVRLLPLSSTKSTDGGHLPDQTAIAKGLTAPEYESNARHLTENIGYYRREEIIDRMFSYGEVAAFLRGLKAAGFDLEQISRGMVAS